jgi:hypothetical protein
MAAEPYWALELGYYDLGSYKFHGSDAARIDGEAQAKSFGISAVGIIPLDQFELYGASASRVPSSRRTRARRSTPTRRT